MTFNEIELDTHIRCAHAMEPSEPFENFTPVDSRMKESILTSDEVRHPSANAVSYSAVSLNVDF